MSEKNESVAEVPAEGNSADKFFNSAKTATVNATKKTSWPWIATAATAVVAGFGGYAIGHFNSFDHRPAGFENMMGDGQGQMPGPFGGQHMRGHMGQMGPGMMDDDDMMRGQIGPDGQRGIDPDGDNWTGTNRQPEPSTSPSAAKS